MLTPKYQIEQPRKESFAVSFKKLDFHVFSGLPISMQQLTLTVKYVMIGMIGPKLVNLSIFTITWRMSAHTQPNWNGTVLARIHVLQLLSYKPGVRHPGIFMYSCTEFIPKIK